VERHFGVLFGAAEIICTIMKTFKQLLKNIVVRSEELQKSLKQTDLAHMERNKQNKKNCLECLTSCHSLNSKYVEYRRGTQETSALL
jgi:hypothetical protein